MELCVTGFPPSFVIPARVGIHKNGIVCYWIPDQVGNDKGRRSGMTKKEKHPRITRL